MPDQSVVRSWSYFQTFIPLPHFTIIVLQGVLKPYHVSVLPDGASLGALLERCCVRAFTELAETCVALDLGESLLKLPPTEIIGMYDMCLTRGFPQGDDAFDTARLAARQLKQIPAKLYAQANLNAEYPDYLEVISRPFVQKFVTLPENPDMWSEGLWRRYFQNYPGDTFRIPILHAMKWLVQNRPELVPPRIQSLFPSFFDTTVDFPHTRWYEYDYIPGVSDPATAGNAAPDDDEDDDEADPNEWDDDEK